MKSYLHFIHEKTFNMRKFTRILMQGNDFSKIPELLWGRAGAQIQVPRSLAGQFFSVFLLRNGIPESLKATHWGKNHGVQLILFYKSICSPSFTSVFKSIRVIYTSDLKSQILHVYSVKSKSPAHK